MRVSLMHNPKAGEGHPAKPDLIRQFKRAGHKVVYYSTKAKDFSRGLEDPGDVIVIAGGDGTVRKIGSRLIGRNVPVAILPLGTANNIARAFGLKRSPQHIIGSLTTARAVKLDVGIARGPWGDLPFFEAVGVGLFARMMADHASDRQQGNANAAGASGGFKSGVHLLRKALARMEGVKCVIRLDARKLTGSYLLIEVMNTPSIGPALKLAPNARPGDGLLDVVLVPAGRRRELERRLAAEFTRKKGPRFSVRRARQVTLTYAGTKCHLDDEFWPQEGNPRSRRPIQIEIGVFPGALRVLVP